MNTEHIDALAEGGEGQALGFTEESLALLFAERNVDKLRYVAAWGKWFLWDGARWKIEETLRAFDMSREICREAAARCNNPSTTRQIASAKTVHAVQSLARADRRLAATKDQFDRDPWLLNTPDGIVDLRTGTLGRHRQEEFCSKITKVGPAPAGTDCPLWRQVLDRIANGNQELVDYFQRAAGYSLTGSVEEHCLLFAYGTGANGKGTMLNTFEHILGDYASVASMDAFTATKNDRHPTDVAMLRGARFVTAQETEEGRSWAEAKIKTMTGGDKLTARFMRQDFFSFEPQFTLWIAGNHKPGLRNIDEAIRRRLHLIPFTVTIPPAERDPKLAEKLRGEAPAILRWMIDGCIAWQQKRLAPPAVVVEATDAYLEAEDTLAQWLDECCDTSATWPFETNANLFGSWRDWTTRAGELSGSQKRFGQLLEARGLTRARQGTAGQRGFTGIRIKRMTDYRAASDAA